MDMKELLGQVPNLTGPIYHESLKTYLKNYQSINKNSEISFGSIDVDAAEFSEHVNKLALAGYGCYCPIKDRFYITPNGEFYREIGEVGISEPHFMKTSTLFYIDCKTGEVVSYEFKSKYEDHEETPNVIYNGSVYSPKQKRIYFIPGGYAKYSKEQLVALGMNEWDSPQPATRFHYIDCTSGKVIEYIASSSMLGPFKDYINRGVGGGAYMGGVYSPVQNKIFYTPFIQFGSPVWHGFDCETCTIFTYKPNLNVKELAAVDIVGRNQPWYWGGTYSPTQDRIYLTPFNQSNFLITLPVSEESHQATRFHYIDCATQDVGSYEHVIPWQDQQLTGNDRSFYMYTGSVYSPIENRIYFNPLAFAPGSRGIHYVDCNTGTCGLLPIVYDDADSDIYSPEYVGLMAAIPVYSPASNRIYYFRTFEKRDWVGDNPDQGIVSELMSCYIDCDTGTMLNIKMNEINGDGISFYSPVNNRIYVYARSGNKIHFIQENSTATIPRQLTAHQMFK